MIIPISYAQVNLHFIGTPLPTGAEVTFGIDISGHGGSPTAVATDVLGDIVSSTMTDLWTSAITLDEVSVKFGPNSTGASGAIPAAVTGGTTGPPDSPNTSSLLRKITASGGRAGRGRMYWPGISQQVLSDNGAVSGTFVTQINGRCSAFLAALTADNLPMVVLHGAGSPLSTPSPVTQLLMDPLVATQRRRLRR